MSDAATACELRTWYEKGLNGSFPVELSLGSQIVPCGEALRHPQVPGAPCWPTPEESAVLSRWVLGSSPSPAAPYLEHVKSAGDLLGDECGTGQHVVQELSPPK
ncbi:Hypothetical predicted protein [Podarcis lilfordi]|uniref:Uncharacterized protein n=1 Tax=Podarcis lilfordi TaxID=74358 RepID=A0AA35VYV6_9SAUR|nr:Hypothetical predicted protein [Podarcis lilfordi]